MIEYRLYYQELFREAIPWLLQDEVREELDGCHILG